METQEKLKLIENYIDQSKLFLRNVDELIEKKELNKAGEMLWGSIAELLKAIGIINNYPTRTHAELMNLAQVIYTITNDVELRKAIKRDAQALHANFYQNFMDEEIFHECRISVLKAYEQLFKIILNNKIS